jgi:hypothetical protein
VCACLARQRKRHLRLLVTRTLIVSAVQIPDAIATYIAEKNWDEAFYVAQLFSIDPRPIMEAIITHCIYNMKSQPNR